MIGFFLATLPLKLDFLMTLRTVSAQIFLPMMAEVSTASLTAITLGYDLNSFIIFLFATLLRTSFLPLPHLFSTNPSLLYLQIIF